MELKRVKGVEHRAPHCREISRTPLLMKTMKSEVLEGKVLFRDDLSDLKIKALKFDDNFKPKNHID